MLQLYGLKLLAVCHYHVTMGIYDSEDLMFLIRHLSLCNLLFKGSYDFVGGSPLQYVTTFPCLLVIGLV